MVFGNDYEKKMMSDINITPFVDVMLVLLIIFMVTAPLMTQGVDVNLPDTESASIKSSEDPLTLTLNKDRKVFLENSVIGIADLDAKLKNIFKYRKNKEILLRADEELPYGFVIEVVALVKKAGVDKLGMVTEPVH